MIAWQLVITSRPLAPLPARVQRGLDGTIRCSAAVEAQP
jgi:hypothetical protein